MSAARGESVLEVLSPQPSEGRLEAGRIIDAWSPAEHLSRFAIAEALVRTQHVHGLSRQQRLRVQTRGPAQESVAVLERETDGVRHPIRQTPSHLRAAEAVGQAIGELLPGDVEAVADVEALAGRGFVAAREDRGLDEIVPVAQTGDCATAVDQEHVAVSHRARDLADDVRRTGAVDSRRT